MSFFANIFGTYSSRELKRVEPLAVEVERLEPEFQKLTDAELRAKTDEFKRRLEDGETMDDILPEAFAAIREAGVRVLGQRAFHVQLIGGIVLHQGRIAEMKTGEGKTLTAILPCYLNGLTGNGVHVVTVNSYLAKYQSDREGKILRFMGVSVGLVVHGMTNDERRAAYACDVTYGTNNEFGFDYLRDNMSIYKEDMVQRSHVFAIVDEVDSILIDEARTPLIISGQGDKSTDLYTKADAFAAKLRMHKVVQVDTKAEEGEEVDADYIVDEKAKSATLTKNGVAKAEQFFGVENITDTENTTLYHHITQALQARGVKKRDIDYVVKDGQVIIVDEFTGRLMLGRRYSDGLHQAIEAKEKVKVERESKTLATITFQNYFRMYTKLSGMTGTALTEEEEFRHIYKLDIIEVPTNKPMVRKDYPDAVYRTELGKYRAVIVQVKECHERQQPVLVGTVSIEKSELLSALLKKEGIPHSVLNAKHHEKEAEIVAQAGHLGAVTIATNMAGRGTDIMLGGNAEFLARAGLRKAGVPEEIILEAVGHGDTDNEEILNARNEYQSSLQKYKEEISSESEKVCAAGGLFIIGTERHEARRIDNQLRGRAGRQGDPGCSRFFISMEDDLLRLFGTGRMTGLLDTLGMDDETPIEHKILSNAIENAQKRMESRNFQSRKHVLEYDDVMNVQRNVIYGQRKRVLDGENIQDHVLTMLDAFMADAVSRVTGERRYIDPEQMEEIALSLENLVFPPSGGRMTREELEGVTPDDVAEKLQFAARELYAAKEKAYGEPVMREIERVALLRMVDTQWMDHIDAMTELRQGISLRAYAQTDPVVAYKREGFGMFEEMIERIRDSTIRYLLRVQVRTDAPKRVRVAGGNMVEHAGGGEPLKKQPVRKTAAAKVGRNDPCPCGSGKKYKKCCGFESGSAASQ
ncbi:MAG: preprotein translocase subunit SecA [Oscillospiraceae bacterium]|jgi:preprotein translocase subunit SecA|nr:preprotein translocase subunit SecA [Oscillospiraceae bacterium]